MVFVKLYTSLFVCLFSLAKSFQIVFRKACFVSYFTNNFPEVFMSKNISLKTTSLKDRGICAFKNQLPMETNSIEEVENQCLLITKT